MLQRIPAKWVYLAQVFSPKMSFNFWAEFRQALDGPASCGGLSAVPRHSCSHRFLDISSCPWHAIPHPQAHKVPNFTLSRFHVLLVFTCSRFHVFRVFTFFAFSRLRVFLVFAFSGFSHFSDSRFFKIPTSGLK